MDPGIDALKITGIDADLGLKRVGGKRERYESLLRKFADKQAGTVVVVRAALAAGDLAAAEREVHSLKGAAAALGAVTLSETASAAEESLKTRIDVDKTLQSLASALNEVVEAIRVRLP